MAVSDWSGQAWLQGFNDVGTTVFGMDADALMHIKVIAENTWPLILTLN